MILSRYCKSYHSTEDSDSVVLYSTKKASSILLPFSMLADIESGNLIEEEKETLEELGFLVKDHDTETTEVSGLIGELNTLNKTFHVKPVMNLDCNLACKYCFEGQRKGKFYMTQETADSFIHFVGERISADLFEEVGITFYGGEPLLSLDLILYMSGKLKKLSESKGLRFSFSFITNGTLFTRKTVEKLIPLGLKSAAITIDGPREIHDFFRPFKGGAGSFDAIFRNVGEVCGITDVQIGGNFTRESYKEYPLLLDIMLASGLTPDKISQVRFDPVMREREGIASPGFHEGCVSLSEPWLFEAMVFLREEILKRGFSSGKIMPSTCMMEYTHSLVLNHDGSIYKCPGFIDRPEFKVGDLRKGIEDYKHSHNLESWKNEECLECAYLPLCFGGCRYMKFIRDGNMKGVDCRKPYYDATLEAFVKQDIKYGLCKRG
jgi:uncharacterized protein